MGERRRGGSKSRSLLRPPSSLSLLSEDETSLSLRSDEETSLSRLSDDLSSLSPLSSLSFLSAIARAARGPHWFAEAPATAAEASTAATLALVLGGERCRAR